MPCHNNRLSFSLGFADIIHPASPPLVWPSQQRRKQRRQRRQHFRHLRRATRWMRAAVAAIDAARHVLFSFLPFAVVPLVYDARAA